MKLEKTTIFFLAIFSSNYFLSLFFFPFAINEDIRKQNKIYFFLQSKNYRKKNKGFKVSNMYNYTILIEIYNK